MRNVIKVWPNTVTVSILRCVCFYTAVVCGHTNNTVGLGLQQLCYMFGQSSKKIEHTSVSELLAQLIAQTSFAYFPVPNYRSNSCCTFLPCFIQHRSLLKKLPSAKITELIPAGSICCNFDVTKLQN